MCAEDLDVQKVSGLGIGTDIGSIGYVVSAKQDVVTSHFTTGLIESFYYRSLQRSSKRILIFRVQYVPAWFQLDDEPEQIAIYSKPSVLKVLEENNVLTCR